MWSLTDNHNPFHAQEKLITAQKIYFFGVRKKRLINNFARLCFIFEVEIENEDINSAQIELNNIYSDDADNTQLDYICVIQ